MLPIAKVVKSFGTDGGMLLSGAIDAGTLDLQEPVFVEFDGLQVPFFILDCTPHGKRSIVHMNDVNCLADAEEMVGHTVWADVEEEDEEDFTDWAIFDRGRQVGVCTGMEDIPGNPCLNVRLPDSREVLLPLHEDFILSVDDRTRSLNLDLPEGLF